MSQPCESFSLERRVSTKRPVSVYCFVALPGKDFQNLFPSTFQTRRVEFNEELRLARRLHDGLDPLQLDPGPLHAAVHIWARHTCGATVSATKGFEPTSVGPRVTEPVLAPYGGTTPTSKVAKTGE